MISDKYTKGVWLRILIFLVLMSGAIFLFTKITISTIIALILSPLLSFLAVENLIPFINQKSTLFITSLLLFIAFIGGVNLISTYREREDYYVRNFIDGKMVTKDIVVEEEGGALSWSTKTSYIPDTKKGENVMKVVKYSLHILALISVLLTFYFFKVADTTNKEEKLKEYRKARNNS